VPWLPELFTAPALARFEDEFPPEDLVTVPFFPGLMTGETDALIQSFASEPGDGSRSLRPSVGF
jgi:hypothetical protein